MNEVQLRFLDTIKYFLKDETVLWDDVMEDIAWNEIFKMSDQHNVFPMTYEAVYGSKTFMMLPPELQGMYKNKMVQAVITQLRATDEFLKCYEYLITHGICPMVVKGIICRNLYKRPDHRISNDEDMFIPKEMAVKCHELLLQDGFQSDWVVSEDIPDEITYVHGQRGLLMEVHNSLFPRDSKAYGEFNELFSHSYENKITEEINGVHVYTMNHEDHFVYLICHALKHFLHSGFGIRQVCDIVIYGKTYENELNWESIDRKLERIYGKGFTSSIFKIGERYFDIHLENIKFSQLFEKMKVECEPMLIDLLEGGVFGDSSMTRKHSSTITLNAVSAAKKNQKHSLLATVFPSKAYLEHRYEYLKKYPYLLPVAWMNRIVTYKKQVKERVQDNPYESMELGKQRIELLKKYGIIE
ncbi:MAG: nucleotidyltransferase family protein [Anaerostipes sp.]|nr:nucleotidyltransferase family protein [Anaerostipes sp.]